MQITQILKSLMCNRALKAVTFHSIPLHKSLVFDGFLESGVWKFEMPLNELSCFQTIIIANAAIVLAELFII